MKVVTIGRGAQNDVDINDDTVSRHHCQIAQIDRDTFNIVDLGSANGTYVNGNLIKGPTVLNVNDIVRIGNTTLPWRRYFGNVAPIPITDIVENAPRKRCFFKRRLFRQRMYILPLVLGIIGVLAIGNALVFAWTQHDESALPPSSVEKCTQEEPDCEQAETQGEQNTVDTCLVFSEVEISLK